jgi:hypothetical protein
LAGTWHLLLPGVASDSGINLIVASLDLQLVRLLRGAIATNLKHNTGPVLTPQPVIEPRRHIHPEPVIEPRRHIHPLPVIDSVACSTKCSDECLNFCVLPAPTAPVSKTKSPIEPPWKVLPWENPPQPAPKVKIVIKQPDNVNRGKLLDLFM